MLSISARAIWGGDGALLGGEELVAAAQGHAVGLAHHGAGDNLHVAADVGDQAADDGDLLPVLLAKVGAGGLDDVEQAAHHLADAIEMARTMGALHDRRLGRKLKVAGIGSGVDVAHGRREDEVGATSLAKGAVGLQCAGIAFEVGGVVELCGVEEYGDHRHVVFLGATLDERGVALVEGTHRGDESHRLSLLARSEERVLQVCVFFKYFHYLQNISGAK